VILFFPFIFPGDLPFMYNMSTPAISPLKSLFFFLGFPEAAPPRCFSDDDLKIGEKSLAPENRPIWVSSRTSHPFFFFPRPPDWLPPFPPLFFASTRPVLPAVSYGQNPLLAFFSFRALFSSSFSFGFEPGPSHRCESHTKHKACPLASSLMWRSLYRFERHRFPPPPSFTLFQPVYSPSVVLRLILVVPCQS